MMGTENSLKIDRFYFLFFSINQFIIIFGLFVFVFVFVRICRFQICQKSVSLSLFQDPSRSTPTTLSSIVVTYFLFYLFLLIFFLFLCLFLCYSLSQRFLFRPLVCLPFWKCWKDKTKVIIRQHSVKLTESLLSSGKFAVVRLYSLLHKSQFNLQQNAILSNSKPVAVSSLGTCNCRSKWNGLH